MSQTTLFNIAAGLFFIAALINFLSAETAQGAAFVALGAAFVAIGSSHRNTPTTATPIHLSETQQRELQTLADNGQKVAAIRRVREETGAGPKEAKAYVDQLEPRMTK